MTNRRAKLKPEPLRLSKVPTGTDSQGRTSPRAQTIPSGKVYRRRAKHPRGEDG